MLTVIYKGFLFFIFILFCPTRHETHRILLYHTANFIGEPFSHIVKPTEVKRFLHQDSSRGRVQEVSLCRGCQINDFKAPTSYFDRLSEVHCNEGTCTWVTFTGMYLSNTS